MPFTAGKIMQIVEKGWNFRKKECGHPVCSFSSISFASL